MTASSGCAHAPPLHVETITDGQTTRILLRLKQIGRDVTTCGASPMLRAVGRVLGIEDELGLH